MQNDHQGLALKNHNIKIKANFVRRMVNCLNRVVRSNFCVESSFSNEKSYFDII